MSKPKSPLLSLGAKGTIGNTLTYQKRNQGTIVRAKPVPSYRYTLAQAYQRWLYKDYAYLWTQQSQATKQFYTTAAHRHHLTGFQYWMKYQLTNLPDIAGWWKLDDNTGATTIDSSRNGNTGTIIGASPATGIIDRCLSLDGINDYVNIPHSASLNLIYPFSAEVFVKTTTLRNMILAKGFTFVPDVGWFLYIAGTGQLEVGITDGIAPRVIDVSNTAINDGIWHHLVTVIEATQFSIYIDGSLDKAPKAHTKGSLANPHDFRIGTWETLAIFYDGLSDNVILYNRALDSTEIKRHSERRYPP